MKEFLELFYQCSGICTDTRKIKKDCFYVGLKGENFNGNRFALEALRLGAKYAVVDESEYVVDKNIFLVKNSLKFLQNLANVHRNRFKIPVIGITGSNGKTSTKELINIVLQKKYNVLCTVGNLNNHIGVPLTLLGLNNSHELAIIEMGANHVGEIEELCQIAEPNYGIITNIGKAHLEGFGDFDGVFKTKTALYNFVIKSTGEIVYNADDKVLTDYLKEYSQKHSYGTTEAMINGNLIELNPYVKLEWIFKNENSNIVQTQLIGKYNFYNFLAAISFGKLFELSNQEINEAISSYVSDNKRSEIRKTTYNTIIIDCYNANPSSMKMALESFSLMKNEKSVAILGDMKELGKESSKEHSDLIALCDNLNIAYVTIGEEFYQHSENGFKDINSFLEYLNSNPMKDHTILLKGSRGMVLEKLIEFL